jgi:hypothetical protein
MNRFYDPGYARRIAQRLGNLSVVPFRSRDVLPAMDLSIPGSFGITFDVTVDISAGDATLLNQRPGYRMVAYQSDKGVTVGGTAISFRIPGGAYIRFGLDATARTVHTFAGGLKAPALANLILQQGNVADTAIQCRGMVDFVPCAPDE